ncbi:unannotated protein [freshwater metagenome]|uniref:Unannotated protein n=1 Tax=freshwater metagenome TaxID=449393 RepID=A0A6J6CWS0_9ZZZZ
MGFIEETGVAQHYRDARITTIYEGTNGIQAMDLVGRKLPMKGGAVVMGLFDEIEALDVRLKKHPEFDGVARELRAALAAVRTTTKWLMENVAQQTAVLSAATPYLRQLSVLVGGFVMAESADDALHSDLPADYVSAKVDSARFFCEQILPSVHGLSGAVMGDDALLMSFDQHRLSL